MKYFLSIFIYLLSQNTLAKDCGSDHPKTILSKRFNTGQFYLEDYKIHTHILSEGRNFYFYTYKNSCGIQGCDTSIFSKDSKNCWLDAGSFVGEIYINDEIKNKFKTLSLERYKHKTKILFWNSKKLKYEAN